MGIVFINKKIDAPVTTFIDKHFTNVKVNFFVRMFLLWSVGLVVLGIFLLTLGMLILLFTNYGSQVFNVVAFIALPLLVGCIFIRES